ncbi:hypothetical protein ACQ86O_07895 [Serratia sp. L9]|uniref:hypothetical protein n=1 Tax=Serratia sp. L9 TaxID=3423946 RepID=UPI003D66C39E
MLNNRNRSFIWLISFALIAGALLFNILMHKFVVRERSPYVSCTSFFTVQSDFKTEGVMSLDLDGNGQGRMSISGNVLGSADSKKLTLLRDINFQYRYEGNGYLTLQQVTVQKNARDNIPDALLNESIFDFSLGSRRLRLTKVENGYLLWNAFSPVLMCISNI